MNESEILRHVVKKRSVYLIFFLANNNGLTKKTCQINSYFIMSGHLELTIIQSYSMIYLQY